MLWNSGFHQIHTNQTLPTCTKSRLKQLQFGSILEQNDMYLNINSNLEHKLNQVGHTLLQLTRWSLKRSCKQNPDAHCLKYVDLSLGSLNSTWHKCTTQHRSGMQIKLDGAKFAPDLTRVHSKVPTPLPDQNEGARHSLILDILSHFHST